MTQDLENDIIPEQFKDPTSWKKLRTILHTHPNPITRHEACFIVGELNIAKLIPDLMQVAEKDSSIVARHEAIEALGNIKVQDIPTINNFLANLKANPKNDPLLNHRDIIATLEIALKRLARVTSS